jgi:hypothetical protein
LFNHHRLPESAVAAPALPAHSMTLLFCSGILPEIKIHQPRVGIRVGRSGFRQKAGAFLNQ